MGTSVVDLALHTLGGIGLLSVGLVPLRVSQVLRRARGRATTRGGSKDYLGALSVVAALATLGLDAVVFIRVAKCLTSTLCGPGVASGWLYLAVLGAAYVSMELGLALSRVRPSTKLLTMMKRKSKLIILVVIVVLLLWAGFWLRRQLSIDGCLDQGGSWNYSISQCQSKWPV